jgi:hypothetical protein
MPATSHHLAPALATGRLALGSGGDRLEGVAGDAAQADGGESVRQYAGAILT